jgi:hypothetical protein
VVIDYTITVGNIIETAVILSGGIMVMVRLNNNVTKLGFDMAAVQNEIAKIGQLMTQVAVQKERMDSLGAQLNRLDIRYDELRHGSGFVRGAAGIDREY